MKLERVRYLSVGEVVDLDAMVVMAFGGDLGVARPAELDAALVGPCTLPLDRRWADIMVELAGDPSYLRDHLAQEMARAAGGWYPIEIDSRTRAYEVLV